jgi:peptidylamidoglycolate lyase
MTISNTITGENGFQYKVDPSWGNADASKYPVKDCHEMVLSKNGLLYMLTNEIRNNILIYNKDGEITGSWGNEFPGGHGLSIHDENGEEFLYITDTDSHKVAKTTLDGRVVLELDYPKETGQYSSADLYKPTETTIGDNGDIFVTDGYGLQFVIQYNDKGEYIRHWGGKGIANENFDCAHGIVIDSRDAGKPTLLITSRNENAFKRFSMDGLYLETIVVPGSFVCRPVIHGKNIYAAVFRSGSNENFGSGFVTILDENNKVVSSPGATGEKIFIHPHDVCVDEDENLYVPQWNANQSYPVKLERIR